MMAWLVAGAEFRRHHHRNNRISHIFGLTRLIATKILLCSEREGANERKPTCYAATAAGERMAAGRKCAAANGAKCQPRTVV